ncbi:MAG: hypothetical protein ACREOE_06705 [Gemmatimonadales bacterium]
MQHPSRVSAAHIAVGAAPAALLLPWAVAVAERIATARGREIPRLSLTIACDLLLDLVLRADSLHCPAAVTYQGWPLLAIVPLDWADELAPAAASVAGPRTTAPEGLSS